MVAMTVAITTSDELTQVSGQDFLMTVAGEIRQAIRWVFSHATTHAPGDWSSPSVKVPSRIRFKRPHSIRASISGVDHLWKPFRIDVITSSAAIAIGDGKGLAAFDFKIGYEVSARSPRARCHTRFRHSAA